MTFQRSIFFSFSIHLLLFGGAIAFAQYGHMLGRSDAITVVLVGSGKDAISNDRKSTGSRAERLRHDGKPQNKTASADRDKFVTTAMVTSSREVSLEKAAASGKSGDVLVEKSGNGRESSAGSQFGILTPDLQQLIQAALERAKTYPRMARERGIEGVTYVRFLIRPSGDAERVEIVRSSGHKILDAASVKTVYRAGILPPVKGWVEVPISYRIQN